MSTCRWNCARLLIAATLAGTAGAGAQQKPFTLEQVTSAPFPTHLIAARAGGKIAWVFDARGARNVWVAEPPDYKARAVTAYTDDDGQDLAPQSAGPQHPSLHPGPERLGVGHRVERQRSAARPSPNIHMLLVKLRIVGQDAIQSGQLVL